MTNTWAYSDHIKSAWYVDSAATAHMTFNRTAFTTYESVTPFPVKMGDNSAALAVGKGDVRLRICKNGKLAICDLRDVLHVPSFVYSLLSVPTLAKRGITVQFSEDRVKILSNELLLASGTRKKGLYALDLFKPREQETALASASLQVGTSDSDTSTKLVFFAWQRTKWPQACKSRQVIRLLLSAKLHRRQDAPDSYTTSLYYSSPRPSGPCAYRCRWSAARPI